MRGKFGLRGWAGANVIARKIVNPSEVKQPAKKKGGIYITGMVFCDLNRTVQEVGARIPFSRN